MHPLDFAITLMKAVSLAGILYFAIRCLAIVYLGLYDAMAYPPI